jgi:hypothetical protein
MHCYVEGWDNIANIAAYLKKLGNVLMLRHLISVRQCKTQTRHTRAYQLSTECSCLCTAATAIPYILFARLHTQTAGAHRGNSHAAHNLLEACSQLLAHDSVKRAKRLVKQQQLRVAGQRTRERDTLPLPSRQLPRVPV